MKSSSNEGLALKKARTRLYRAMAELEKAASRMLDEFKFAGTEEIHGKLKQESKV